VREVRVLGTLTHVTREQVDATVKKQLTGNFFTVDLAGARRAFERLPWVRRVEVRRVWPDRLHVVLDEHVAIARWNDSGLVNTHGEVFSAASDAKLPVFDGPQGSAQEMARQYTLFSDALAAVRLSPSSITLSQRRAWEVRLSSGLTLKLGRDQVNERLATFLSVYERTVAPVSSRLDYVDLRYPNGFAVRLTESNNEGRSGGRPSPRSVEPKPVERRS
jgi:cell division protein FtsQ